MNSITNTRGKEYHHLACIDGTDIWFNQEPEPFNGYWNFCYVIPSRDIYGNIEDWDSKFWYVDGSCETFSDAGIDEHDYTDAEEKAILEYIHFHHKLMS